MWIDVDGLANLRDVGGIPTVDGQTITPGKLLRSDNLQSLTESDIERLLELGLTDVIDLRSNFEVASEGPGPLTDRPEVTIHHHSLFREEMPGQGEPKPDVRPEVIPEEALPWVDLEPTVQVENRVASIYLSYLADRPDSIVASLREIAAAEGAALVHCAAGKDRTGTVVALALLLAGADPGAVVQDYAASSERVQGIVDRLLASGTYAANLVDRPLSSHLTHPETMVAFLEHVDSAYGGVEPLLVRFGWTPADTERIRAKLRG
ncbi:MAG: Protein tyrosine phosphatase [uncultured Propionibacteriaceae bacterium]|uniref:Protein tyrosine phosphatase n=1 Tax=uncultured Propionibacteriaceae bacterium TaxID=257457 RepID=A0A6J4NFE5_9ACTN|nr:MAG: Protein tyrosine phosphatase [uncultured Propionibacteriaceae bacterium]